MYYNNYNVYSSANDTVYLFFFRTFCVTLCKNAFIVIFLPVISAWPSIGYKISKLPKVKSPVDDRQFVYVIMTATTLFKEEKQLMVAGSRSSILFQRDLG